jgi:DNA replication protein DnaC
VLDDLGRERVTDWWVEQLQRIVDSRCGNERRLVVTANATADPRAAYDELVARYGDPIVERILDGGGVIVLDGPAQRELVTEW